MNKGNTANLLAAAQRKREQATSRADTAIRELIRTRQPITFRSVARESGCSIDFLYKTPAIRARIDQLRTQQAGTPAPARPTIPTDSGIVHTLTAQLNELRQRHHSEVTELKAALAAAHGELLLLRRSAEGTAIASQHPASVGRP